MMRLAQLGCGRWGRKLRRAFAAVDGVEVVLVCDPEPEVVAALPDGVAFSTDERAALERADVDAVVIATPPELHHAQARRALVAGKHVFVEKPLALGVENARDLVALAAEAARTLMVGHVVLFDEPVHWIKRFIDGGGLGEVRCARFRRRGRPRPDRAVDAMWNLAPHDVSLADYWLGEPPLDVEAYGWSSRADGVDETAIVKLRYSGGREVEIQVGGCDERRAVVVGSESTVVYESAPAARLTVHRPRSGQPRVVELAGKEPLRREAEHFADCVRAGRPPLSDGESGLRVVSTLVAAARSRDQRAPVVVTEQLGEPA